MQQNWNIKTRSHECSRSGRPFEEGEVFHTSIYFDNESGEFVRRDVALDVWEDEVKERTPLAYWRTTYVKPDGGKPKAEIASKESAEALLRRLIDEDQEHTEHARYILGLMLERKKQLVPKETKYTEQGILLLYEHRKSGEVFIIRDPELRLDEIESVQEEVATLLGFGGPVVEAAKVAGVTLTPDGKIEKKGNSEKEGSEPEKLVAELTAPEMTESQSPPETVESVGAETQDEAEGDALELVESEAPGSDSPEGEENEAAEDADVPADGQDEHAESEFAAGQDEAESKETASPG